MAARVEKAQPFHVSSRRDAMKIARHFSARGLGEQKTIVPEERLNFIGFCISVVPLGLDITPIRNPGTSETVSKLIGKTLGIGNKSCLADWVQKI